MSLPEPQMCMEVPQTSNSAALQSAGLATPGTQQASSKWTDPTAAHLTKVSKDTTSLLSTANKALGGDSSMSGTFKGMNTALSFANCMASGDNIAESTEGSAMACAAKTGISQIPISGPGATPWGLVNMANSYMDVDNPGKIGTQFVSDLNPYANTKTALKSTVDTADLISTAISGNESESYRKAEALEERNRAGKNTVVAEGLQSLVDLGTGDTESYVDNKAETGQRGVKKAWGNAAGDLWHDAIHGERGRAVYRNFDEVKAEHDNMRWYKPWTW